MTSCGWGRTEGQIGFSGWTTSVYPEAINMQEGLILHSLGDFLIPVGFRNSLESRWCFGKFTAFKGNQPQVFTCCDLSGSFCFCHQGENRGFCPQPVKMCGGCHRDQWCISCWRLHVLFSNPVWFSRSFSISQITALYGWMFGGLILVVLPSHLSFLLVSKRWVG